MTDDLNVTVRMYTGLLGDCFLIRCERGEAKSHILIDCGVLQGTEDGKEKMKRVAADIVETTGGDLDAGKPGKLDLLVVTHEHWDHISGFAHAQDIFFDPAKLEIGHLWLAWTEKEGDPLADSLRKRFTKQKKTIALVARDINTRDNASPFGAAPSRAIDNLQFFMGVENGDAMGLVPGGRLTGPRIMTELAKQAGENVSYLEPGTEVVTPGDVPLRTYVLGPPRKTEQLFKDLPTADDEEGHGGHHFSASAFNERLLLGMAGQLDEQDHFAQADASPFARRYRGFAASAVEAAPRDFDDNDEAARTKAWLRAQYYDEAGTRPCRYDPKPDDHDCARDIVCGARQQRRIDGDWLAAAGSLALKLDSDTNNTSLVLAFEIGEKREVLLFAADAQVGNWESWSDHRYDGNDLDALLSRVSFYKVGHHGSHNATLVKKGLLKMGTPGALVAMIPTDEAFAAQQGTKGWRMPDPVVRDPLHAQTRGKTIYGDRKWAMMPAKAGEAPRKDERISAAAPDPAFAKRLDQTNDLYVEYRVLGPDFA